MRGIDKLFSVMEINFNAVAETMRENMIENVKREHPEIPDSEVDAFRDVFNKNADIGSLCGLYADIYERHYTQEEIVGLINYFESPLGRKSVKVNPQITQESIGLSQAYFESLSKEVMEELFEEHDL